MKFISVKQNGDKYFTGNVPFDVKNIELLTYENEFINFRYDIFDFHTKHKIDVTGVYFLIELMKDDLSIEASIEFLGDGNRFIQNLLINNKDLVCNVKMHETERKKLLIYLLNKSLNDKIPKNIMELLS